MRPWCCVGGYGVLQNTYTASTSLYVLAQDGTSEPSPTMQNTLSVSQMITNDVAALIKSDCVKKDTADELGLESLSDYDVSVSSETTTRVITLSVSGEDPDGVAEVADAMAESVSAAAQEVMDVKSVNVIDEAQTPTAPNGPNRPQPSMVV